MYTWHWEEVFWNKVIINFDFHPVAHRYFDPILELKKLVKYNASYILEKQELIRSRVFELQYSLDGVGDKYYFDSKLEYIKVVEKISNKTSNNNSENTSSNGLIINKNKVDHSDVDYITYNKDIVENEKLVYLNQTNQYMQQYNLKFNKIKHNNNKTNKHNNNNEENSNNNNNINNDNKNKTINNSNNRNLNKITKNHDFDRKTFWPIDKKTKKPMKDAYEICIDLALNWHSGILKRFLLQYYDYYHY
jgi:hypothetical protein